MLREGHRCTGWNVSGEVRREVGKREAYIVDRGGQRPEVRVDGVEAGLDRGGVALNDAGGDRQGAEEDALEGQHGCGGGVTAFGLGLKVVRLVLWDEDGMLVERRGMMPVLVPPAVCRLGMLMLRART